MSRYMTRLRTSSETLPLQKATTTRKLSVLQVKKPVFRNKSVNNRMSKIKDNNTTDKKVLRKPERSLAKKRLVSSSRSSENSDDDNEGEVVRHNSPRVVDDNEGKVVRRTSSHVNNDNEEEVARHESSCIEENKISAKTRNPGTRDRTNNNKTDNAVKKKINEKITKNMLTHRQMSLKESFLNQSISQKLRPRRVAKDYKENSTLIESNLSSDKRHSIVRLDRINYKEKKVPVYKSVPLDEPVKDTQKVYDFDFYMHDSKERLPKKQKKRLAKTTVAKKTKTSTRVKRNVQRKTNVEKEVAIVEPMEIEEGINAMNKIQVQVTVHQTEDAFSGDVPKNVVEREHVAGIGNIHNSNGLVQPDSSDNPKPEQKKNNAVAHAKPTVISVESLKNNEVRVKRNCPAVNTEDFKPFRPTNIFNTNNKLQVPQVTAHNQSLFEKSLSPITRIPQFDPGSPWRGPDTFSQFRNVYQSTPQNSRYEIFGGRIVHAENNVSNAPSNITDVKETQQNNIEHISMEKSFNVNNPKKELPTTVRRFGTEITNLDHSVQLSSPAGEVSERITAETENTLPNVQSVVITSSNTNSASMFDEEDDKENSALNYQTPKKIPKKGSKKVKFRNSQETKVKSQNTKVAENMSPRPRPSGVQLRTFFNEQKTLTPKIAIRPQNIQLKENVDPQPGPSGLQRQTISSESKALRQSNLNSFLNVSDMPESTTIQTSHGIFSDTYSTPVNVKTSKKPEESYVGINNAFGFDEDSSQNATPVKITNENRHPTRTKHPRRPNEKVPARLLIRDIRNKLLPTTAENEVTERHDPNPQNKINERKRQAAIDITNFSDTFDILSETGEEPTNTTECPLFVDLEPSHFRQPPKQSYKRKRAVAISFSDGSSDAESEVHEPTVRRKKAGKVNKEDQRRMKEWINNVNRTFSEIDQYDLFVE